MIRVAVIDDEPLARSGVIARLGAFADDVVVACEYADGPAALAGLTEQATDLVFIDVQMPGMNGLDVLAALPASKRPLAILLTAHDSFAVRAFALNAVDYLLKPVDDERFIEALDRARQVLAWGQREQGATAPVSGDAAQWIAEDTDGPPADSTFKNVVGAERDRAAASKLLTRFAIRVGRRTVFVDVNDVEWIQADGDYAAIHAGENVYLLRESLHGLTAQLDPARFVRVHRSTIVRMDRVTELQPLANRDAVLRLHDGTPLRVSRTYIDELLARLCGASAGAA
ncbi:LytR/AlgR family response regulator transcription factor [Lysobacter sp. D1-1-M9]|uniref:LytR/AlgR family response regulator transcription factor n=1 Tax=Novilysobacter longmucuonensis TaxID=3098603 RepID=UPI002FC7A917